MAQFRRRREFSIVGFLGWLYLVALLGWFGMRRLFFDRFWWLALLNMLAFYWFVPIVVLLPLCLWLRQRRLLLGLGVACLLFVGLFHPLFNPLNLFARIPLPAQTGNTLKVMSFNLRWDNRDYGNIAQMIRTIQPDLIGLQELQPGEASDLAAALAPNYPYRVVHPADLFHTVALFSRLPIAAIVKSAFG